MTWLPNSLNNPYDMAIISILCLPKSVPNTWEDLGKEPSSKHNLVQEDNFVFWLPHFVLGSYVSWLSITKVSFKIYCLHHHSMLLGPSSPKCGAPHAWSELVPPLEAQAQVQFIWQMQLSSSVPRPWVKWVSHSNFIVFSHRTNSKAPWNRKEVMFKLCMSELIYSNRSFEFCPYEHGDGALCASIHLPGEYWINRNTNAVPVL